MIGWPNNWEREFSVILGLFGYSPACDYWDFYEFEWHRQRAATWIDLHHRESEGETDDDPEE